MKQLSPEEQVAVLFGDTDGRKTMAAVAAFAMKVFAKSIVTTSDLDFERECEHFVDYIVTSTDSRYDDLSIRHSAYYLYACSCCGVDIAMALEAGHSLGQVPDVLEWLTKIMYSPEGAQSYVDFVGGKPAAMDKVVVDYVIRTTGEAEICSKFYRYWLWLYSEAARVQPESLLDIIAHAEPMIRIYKALKNVRQQ